MTALQTISFPNLEVEIADTEGAVTYTFRGQVDENFRHEDLPRLARPLICFVLGEISHFNSCGIREWIYLVRDLGALGSLVFCECSVAVIDQINMVPDSLGSGRIESFYAPYYCECGGEVNRLIHVATHLTNLAQHQAPPFRCESCGKNLEFDALEESYFLFADSLRASG